MSRHYGVLAWLKGLCVTQTLWLGYDEAKSEYNRSISVSDMEQINT